MLQPAKRTLLFGSRSRVSRFGGAFVTRVLMLIAAVLALPVSAHAHLLNMTHADLLLQSEGQVALTVRLDLSRSMDSPADYYALANSLGDVRHAPLWQRVGNAIVLRNGEERIPLVFDAAVQADDYVYEDFSNPLTWPRVVVTYTSRGRLDTDRYALNLTFTPDFFFEEPIAVSLGSQTHEHRLSRWLVTDQQSPSLIHSASASVRAAQLTSSALVAMAQHGFFHVIPSGMDHLLFLLGLSLLIFSVKKLIVTITLFTLAHCVALLAAVYRLIEISPLIIELGILATIMWLGLRVVGQRSVDKNEAEISFAAIFLFGLLHGLGFSNAFLALAITENVLGQLIAFNLGVEFAQILFVVVSVWIIARLRQTQVRATRINGFFGGMLIALPGGWGTYLLIQATA